MFRLIHTADWHLGARLIDCERHDEHRAFLAWFQAQLATLRPDLLIVAGDVFDSANPPQEALELYYRFLSGLAATVKCQTLILGGNHDSPATLHAPRDVLRALDVRVIASPPAAAADALLVFPEVVVAAVPYLRERDVRTGAPGQSAEEVATAIRTGVVAHYRSIQARAAAAAHGRPLVATGHLTAVGSTGSPSERIIHIGSLGAVDPGCFDGFAYTALGHIHRPQDVGGNPAIRYAGSPIPLSFSEVDRAKEIRVIDVAGATLTHHAVRIPEFRPLLRITVPAAEIRAELARRQGPRDDPLPPWVELTIPDGRTQPDLDRQVREAAGDLRLRVLKVLTPPPAGTGPAADPAAARSLRDLRPEEVFAERLRRGGIEPGSVPGRELTATFLELLSGLHDAGTAGRPEAGG